MIVLVYLALAVAFAAAYVAIATSNKLQRLAERVERFELERSGHLRRKSDREPLPR